MTCYPVNQQRGVPIRARTDLASQIIQDVLEQYANGNLNLGGSPYFAGSTSAGQWGMPRHPATGCPFGSRALVRADRSDMICTEQPCPRGFVCVFAERVRLQFAPISTLIALILLLFQKNFSREPLPMLLSF
ncbi:hypothetical protein Y032_0121g979 [Ancylostoma ceylanicum]|uniref:Uncharacterized protein n=1 Tax=Ancylostoma ceylanicum TaxID=53326 RepID=A0A016T9M2_9BILA|nr:hypothetical protein Y032_0121g979 [Ancylostoma ceylanicum]